MADNINLIILAVFLTAIFMYIAIPFIGFILSGGKRIKVTTRHLGPHYAEGTIGLLFATAYSFLLAFLLNIIVTIIKDILL